MEKVLIFFKSLFFTVYYAFVNFFSKEKISLNEDGEYIVSLTTYNARLRYVYLTIESIINQIYKPSKIILWLSIKDIDNGILPRSLVRLKSRGLEIHIVDEDLRSYKKLTHFCEMKDKYDFKYVVTADDDVFYPTYWLLGFKEKNDVQPGFIYCYRGKSINFRENGTIEDYHHWSVDVSICKASGALLMPTGVSGVCYPKNSLTYDMVDRLGFLQCCRFADDIWYKCCVLKAGFHSKLVLDKNIHFTPVLFSLGKGLEVTNVQNGMNVIQLKNALSYFKMTSIDFI